MKNDSETVIRVENLTAGYGDIAIIKDINFEVQAGEVLIILGGSGCGKSTLLKHMIGHRKETSAGSNSLHEVT